MARAIAAFLALALSACGPPPDTPHTPFQWFDPLTLIARGGELTSWRSGDSVFLSYACPTKADAIAYATGIQDGTPTQHKCRPFAQQQFLLVSWEAGPFRFPRGGAPGSVWAAGAHDGAAVYAVIADDGGPHQPEVLAGEF